MQYHQIVGDIPKIIDQDDDNIDIRGLKQQRVFSVQDFINLYQKYSQQNPSLRSYIESACNIMNAQQFQIINGFTMNETHAVLILSLEPYLQDGLKLSPYKDILIKNIKIDQILPVIIKGTSGRVALDRQQGIFYVQCDQVSGRPCKLMRHQIGTLPSQDVVLYHEDGDYKQDSFEYAIDVQLTKSEDFILVQIQKFEKQIDQQFWEPLQLNNNSNSISNKRKMIANEIWYLPTVVNRESLQSENEFQVIMEMRDGILYDVKHQKGSFYVLVKDIYDSQNNKLVKVDIPFALRNLLEGGRLQSESSAIKKSQMKNKSELELESSQGFEQIKSIVRKLDNQLVQKNQSAQLINLASQNFQIIAKSSTLQKIYNFDIFQHYIALHQHRQFKPQIKIINTQKNVSHFLNLPQLDQLTSEFQIQPNNDFKSPFLRYKILSPKAPDRFKIYNMGMRREHLIHFDEYQNIKLDNYQTERIFIPNRDNSALIPLLITYHKQSYSDKSPFILYTQGMQTQRLKSFKFDPLITPMLDRGFIFGVPMIRGTKLLDEDWFEQGVGSLKANHFTDFIDLAIFLKENKITEKLNIISQGYSGGITALHSLIREPFLFDSACLHNAATDLIFLLERDKAYSESRKLTEFGDFQNDKNCRENIQKFSPYSNKLKHHIRTNLLFSTDSNNLISQAHTLKFLAKLRRKHQSQSTLNQIYYNKFEEMTSEQERRSLQYSFIVNACYSE